MLLAATFFVNPSVGVVPLAKGLVIALLGGLGSIWGAVIAAILVGFTEALTSKYFGPQYALFAMYVLVFAVLVVRPRGIGGMLDEVRAVSAHDRAKRGHGVSATSERRRAAAPPPAADRRAARLLPRLPVSTERTLHRWRWPFSKRRVLHLDGRYNPRTLQRERVITEKGPIWWFVFLAADAGRPAALGQPAHPHHLVDVRDLRVDQPDVDAGLRHRRHPLAGEPRHHRHRRLHRRLAHHPRTTCRGR